MLFRSNKADKDEVVRDKYVDCLGGQYEYRIITLKTDNDGQIITNNVEHKRVAVADCLPKNQAVQARITTYRSGMREVLCPRHDNSGKANSCNLSPNQKYEMREKALKMDVELDERIFGPKRLGIQLEILDTATRCHFAGKK